MTELTCTICDQAKKSTEDLHRAAEGHSFQQALMSGTLPRECYVAYLGQMLHVHRALESALRESTDPLLRRVIQDHYYREEHLIRDLSFYGADPEGAEPSDSCRRLLNNLAASGVKQPVALLGYLYVLEGSNNGGKYIAKAVQRAYGLPPDEGVAYLDPHGDRQRELWLAFRRDVELAGLTPQDVEFFIGAAKEMFDSIRMIFDDLMAAPVPASV